LCGQLSICTWLSSDSLSWGLKLALASQMKIPAKKNPENLDA
jgi:hypothetical protein